MTPEGWGLGSRADSQSIGKRGSRGPEKREGSGECTNAHPPSLVLGKQGEAYGGVEDEEQQWWAALGWLQGQTAMVGCIRAMGLLVPKTSNSSVIKL